MASNRPGLRRKNRFYRKIGRPIQFTPEEIRDLFMEKEKPHVKKRKRVGRTT